MASNLRKSDLRGLRFLSFSSSRLRWLRTTTATAIPWPELDALENVSTFLLAVFGSARSRVEQLELVNHKKLDAERVSARFFDGANLQALGFLAETSAQPQAPVRRKLTGSG